MSITTTKLFTTNDSVDIFEGDKYFTVNINEHKISSKDKTHVVPKLSIVGPYINRQALNPTGDILYFSSWDKASDFVELAKSTIWV